MECGGGIGENGGGSLCLRHRDGGPFGVVEAVHGVQLHDHVQTIGEHQHHEQAGYQPHPDARREEAGAVAGVGEPALAHVEALDLRRGVGVGVGEGQPISSGRFPTGGNDEKKKSEIKSLPGSLQTPPSTGWLGLWACAARGGATGGW